MKGPSLRFAGWILASTLLLAALTSAQPTSSLVQELRTQKVGDVTYFHVRLALPKDVVEDAARNVRNFLPDPEPTLAPRLLGPEDQIRLVCQRISSEGRGRPGLSMPPGEINKEALPDVKEDEAIARAFPKPRLPVPVQGLEFVGRTLTKDKVTAKLVYPVTGRRSRVLGKLMRTPPPPTWREMDVVLDFGKAKEVRIPTEAAERKVKPAPGHQHTFRAPVRDDLEGLWAVARVDQFTELDHQVREFGFYSFAATATSRKYGVTGDLDSSSRWQMRGGPGGDFIDRELYETTTGAAAIAESLQLRRMNAVTTGDAVKRTIPIGTLRGIEIAEHPWKKMMGDKKPAPEAFAQMVPHDNYYVHFKRLTGFLDFGELLDQWGTNLTRAYEVTSRDHRLKQRYQQQLCLKDTILGKTLGPLVIKGVAVTGNDAYLREGSDVAVMFQVVQKGVFLSAVEPFVAEARAKFGAQLKESQSEHHGVKIESFVTPLREVSLHRATIDDVVIYANSPVGLRRILDTSQGRGKRLSDSLDFQYVRTIFRSDDKDEDGFAFLSDAFIRNLVGPASKIKERRRLEALTSLHMLTHGAMLTAWETGKAPIAEPTIFAATGLEREQAPMPEGNPAFWDAKSLVARSDVYNTLHFATPLIELPIDKVTENESQEYDRFRQEYLGLWRQFFDPIGMRVALKDGQVQLDTYILPLIENTSYNELRRITGEKSVRFDPASLGDKTLMQYVLRLSGTVGARSLFIDGVGPMVALWSAALDPVGDWFMFRLDDSPAYEKLLDLVERQASGEPPDAEEVARVIWTLPVAVGVDIRNPLMFAGTLASFRTSVQMSLPGAVTWGPLDKEYKGISIVRIQATPSGRDRYLPRSRGKADDNFLPAIYYAMIDGAFYVTLNEEAMRGLIDQAVGRRDGKTAVEVATSLYLAPKAAAQSRGLLARLLEHQTREQARTSLPIWYALYRSGIVAHNATAEQAQTAAYRYLGFVPVSPDGTAYRYDRAHDEVVSERHGSFRKPTAHRTMAEGSPLNFLLDQLRSVRADLRFREDGIHTVLTLERAKKEK